MTDLTLLKVSGVNKTFGAVTAASDINVSVLKGECIGLIGTNGAGKTTFVNMVTGYLKPDTGVILYEDNDITSLPPREITRLGICRSFQIPQLYNTLTALENIEVSYGIVSLSAHKESLFTKTESMIPGYGKNIRQLAEESLERFGLTAYRDKLTRVLPGGVRKLLDIAMAMAVKPKILMLDEPTMKAIRKDGTTVLFVEHDMEIVSQHAERVLAFYDGEIIADDVPEVALNDAKVLKYIVGDKHSSSVPTGKQHA
jgi:branched-chain amino acid transport system ATP-binding protein